MEPTSKDVVNMVKNMIGQYQVPVTSGQIEDFLFTHPNYPDLISVSDALDEWKIDHVAVKIRPEQLSEITTPFIVSYKNPGETMRLVENVDDNFVHYRSLKQKSVKAEISNFSNGWDGIVLAIAPDEKSGGKDYVKELAREKNQKFRNITAFTMVFGVFLFSLFNLLQGVNSALIYPVLTQLILALLGIAASGFLYSYDKNTAPAFVKDICNHGKEFNCKNVLQSDAGKLFGIISWTEIGLVYFSAVFLAFLWGGSNENISYTLSLFNLAALPYTIYSVYYQRFVAKKWCVLCLAVQGLLWAQFASFYLFGLHEIPVINSPLIQILLVSFALPIIVVVFIDNYVVNNLMLKNYKKVSRRFKQNPDIFKSLLYRSRQINIDDKIDFVLGNPNADVTLTCFISTQCSPCANAHIVLTELLERLTYLKVHYVFHVGNPEKEYTAKLIAAIYEQHSDEASQKALSLLYESKNLKQVEALYPVDFSRFDGEKFVEFNSKLTTRYQIDTTPTVFINGYLLPEIYDINDLSYWLPHLRQYFLQNHSLTN